jgi:hypothetical protein
MLPLSRDLAISAVPGLTLAKAANLFAYDLVKLLIREPVWAVAVKSSLDCP